MAGSRGEKYGTIFSRVTGLLRTGAMKQSDKPTWYEVYAAFPPKTEPKYDRDIDPRPPVDILYREDFLRARFYNTFVGGGILDMRKSGTQSGLCQKFIEKYLELEATSDDKEDILFEKTAALLKGQGIKLLTVADLEIEKEARKKKFSEIADSVDDESLSKKETEV